MSRRSVLAQSIGKLGELAKIFHQCLGALGGWIGREPAPSHRVAASAAIIAASGLGGLATAYNLRLGRYTSRQGVQCLDQ